MSTQFEVMKRIGTFGNYARVTDNNRHLLDSGKMVVVVVEQTETGLKEVNSRVTDLVGSHDTAKMVSEIVGMDSKRKTLIAAVLSERGGEDALTSAGIELPDQNIHNTPVGKAITNTNKQNEKAAEHRRLKTKARTEKLHEAKAAKAKAEGKPYSDLVSVSGYETEIPKDSEPEETEPEEKIEDQFDEDI